MPGGRAMQPGGRAMQGTQRRVWRCSRASPSGLNPGYAFIPGDAFIPGYAFIPSDAFIPATRSITSASLRSSRVGAVFSFLHCNSALAPVLGVRPIC